MKIAILALSVTVVIFGVKAIITTATPPHSTSRSKNDDRTLEEELAKTKEEFQKSLNTRYNLLYAEYIELNRQIEREYFEYFEKRKRLWEQHPELNLPNPEETKLIFIDYLPMKIDPDELDVTSLEQRVRKLKESIPNQSANSTTASAPR